MGRHSETGLLTVPSRRDQGVPIAYATTYRVSEMRGKLLECFNRERNGVTFSTGLFQLESIFQGAWDAVVKQGYWPRVLAADCAIQIRKGRVDCECYHVQGLYHVHGLRDAGKSLEYLKRERNGVTFWTLLGRLRG